MDDALIVNVVEGVCEGKGVFESLRERDCCYELVERDAVVELVD